MIWSLALDRKCQKAFEIYLRVQKNRSEHTCRSYLKTVANFSSFAAKHAGSEIETLKAFIRAESVSQAKSTQSQRISALRTFIRWNESINDVEKEKLLKHLHSPKKQKKVPRIIDLNDIDEVLEYIDSLESFEEKSLFYLLYGSGLRISEALDLKHEDFDLKRNEIRVWGKGSKERIVPLIRPLKKMLKSRGIKKGHIFPPTLHERQAREWVAKWGKETGFETKHGRWHPHMLRHSIASHLSQSGAKLPTIQKLLGHEQMSTTEQYTHIKMSDLLRIYKNSNKL